MPLRLRSAGGGSVQLNSPVALATDVSMEVPGYAGAKLLTNKTPGAVIQSVSTNASIGLVLSSTSYVDTGIPALTLNRTSSNSKILFRLSGGRWRFDQSSGATGFFTSFRSSENNGAFTSLGEGQYAHEFFYNAQNGTLNFQGSHSAAYVYTPATNVTVVSGKVYAAAFASPSVVWASNDQNGAQMFFEMMEIAA